MMSSASSSDHALHHLPVVDDALHVEADASTHHPPGAEDLHHHEHFSHHQQHHNQQTSPSPTVEHERQSEVPIGEESHAVVAAAAAVQGQQQCVTSFAPQPWMIPELQHASLHRSFDFPSAFQRVSNSPNLYVSASTQLRSESFQAAGNVSLPMKRATFDIYGRFVAAPIHKTRRTSHNATEHRRRKRIKEKIDELKDLVPNPNNGLDRNAAILQRTIDYIKELKARCNAYAAAAAVSHKFQRVALSDPDAEDGMVKSHVTECDVLELDQVHHSIRHDSEDENDEDKSN